MVAAPARWIETTANLRLQLISVPNESEPVHRRRDNFARGRYKNGREPQDLFHGLVVRFLAERSDV